MKNPYEVLWLDGPGDNSEVTHEDIRRAFHKASIDTHPDNGGSVEQYQEVQRAYRILCDPHRRRIFDRTGDGNLALNWTAAIEGTLAKVLNDILDEAGKRGEFFDLLGDVTTAMRIVLQAGVADVQKQITGMEDDYSRTRRMAERVVYLGEDSRANVLGSTLAQRGASLRQRIDAALLNVEATLEAIDRLDPYIDSAFKS